MSFLTKIFGDPNTRVVAKFKPIVDAINALESEMQKLSDEQLRAKTTEFKERIAKCAPLDELLPQVFAVGREVSRRVLKMRHFDVQLVGGIVLHKGQIAEMRTGEGKTLVASLPLYLNALQGKGCHLVTVNDYLARRDAEWMGPLYAALGMKVGVLNHEISYLFEPKVGGRTSHLGSGEELRKVPRREAYADITYGTNNEFGFDYLRDNMVGSLEQMAQRPLSFAMIDEIDSILIDEARTPLIISAPEAEASKDYYKYAQVITQLTPSADFNVDEKMRAATFTDMGISNLAKALGRDPWATNDIETVFHLEAALKARTLFARDKEYVVKNDEVIIVDEFTGRLMVGRRYSEGLHQAIEAKERVSIQQESQTLGTVTFQNLFRMYQKLAGMTGTALTEAEEFSKIYKLEVVSIPTNRAMIRKDAPDKIYKTEAAKFNAIVQDVKARHAHGQPVLIGTISIEKNEVLSQLMAQQGINCEVLNAKNHEREGEIIAQAGRMGAVTVATNMAGRGVDIILGGKLDPSVGAAHPEALPVLRSSSATEDGAKGWQEAHDKVVSLGGLHIIGTERHESRRIDNQLRGRAGRQGDPGSSQFFLSLDDDLMRIFGSNRIKGVMERLGMPEDMPIEHSMVSKSIASAQHKVEGHNFDLRKHLLEYDDVLNKHREIFYKKRLEVLQHERINDSILAMINKELERVVLFHTADQDERQWNMKEITEVAGTIVPLPHEVKEKLQDLKSLVGDVPPDVAARTALIEYLSTHITAYYKNLEEKLTAHDPKLMGRVERSVVLRAMDTLWVDHLSAIDYLRAGIGLQGYGQRDPLVEYKREAYQLFTQLLSSIDQQVVYGIFKFAEAHLNFATQNLSGQAQEQGILLKRQGITLGAPAKAMNGKGVSMRSTDTVPAKVRTLEGSKVGRNDLCPCGSGKKYKKCHGD